MNTKIATVGEPTLPPNTPVASGVQVQISATTEIINPTQYIVDPINT